MRVNVLIVEDDPITAMDLKGSLTDHGIHITDTVESGEKAIMSIQANKPDVILMDVKLDGELDGISTVNLINESDSIPIVYLTANTDQFTANRAFQTHPAAFLSKPFDERDIVNAIELAFNNHLRSIFESEKSIRTNSCIFLKSSEKYEKVQLADILYIQADGSYSKVYTKDKDYVLSSNLNSLWQKMTHTSFFRIHRSYLVNIDNVTGFDHTYVYFDDQYVPFSKNNKEELMKKLKKLS